MEKVASYLWFQISTDSDIYWHYHVGFWDTRYDNPKISSDITTDIFDMADIC